MRTPSLTTRLLLTGAALSLLAVPRALAAQSPPVGRWSFELGADAAIPTGSLAGADLKTGPGFGANVRFRFQPHLAAYAGWEWHQFRSAQILPGQTLDVEDTGYTFGLRFEHPLRGEGPMGLAAGTGPTYWLRAGGLANHFELEDRAGGLVTDTNHGLGWELGAGLTFPVGSRFSVTPGARYRSVSRDLTVGSATRDATLSYVTLGVGAAFSW